MEPMKVANLIDSEKGKDLFFKGFKFRFRKILTEKWNDGVVLTKNVNVS